MGQPMPSSDAPALELQKLAQCFLSLIRSLESFVSEFCFGCNMHAILQLTLKGVHELCHESWISIFRISLCTSCRKVMVSDILEILESFEEPSIFPWRFAIFNDSSRDHLKTRNNSKALFRIGTLTGTRLGYVSYVVDPCLPWLSIADPEQ